MATYVPNADELTQPTEDKELVTAAAEFRTLKAKVESNQTRIDTLEGAALQVVAGEYLATAPIDMAGHDIANAGDIAAQSITTATLQVGPYIFVPEDFSPDIDAALRGDLASTGAGKGAEIVAFKQSGTSAVDRTASDKLREMVSVKDFGAVGDGVTDDTAAIQKAIDELSADGGGYLLFPAGVYKTRPLSMKSNVAIIGKGATLKNVEYGTLLTANACSGAAVFDIRFEGVGDGTANYECGILVTNGALHIERARFHKFNDEGVSFGAGSIACKLINCYGENLCLNYARTSRTGTVRVGGTDHQLINNEFGSAQNYLPSGSSPGNGWQSITSENLYNCAYFITGANCFFSDNRGQNADVGFWIDSSSVGIHRFVNNRGDQCWAYSFNNEANNSVITNHFYEQVSLQGSGLYPAVRTTGGNNRYVNCHGRAVDRDLGPTNGLCLPSYAYYDGVAAGPTIQKNSYIHCTGAYQTGLIYTTAYEGSAFQTPMLSSRQTGTVIDAKETSFVVLAHTSTTTITDITGDANGKELTILSASNSVVYIQPSARIKTLGGPVRIATNDVVQFVCYNNVWHQYVGRPIAKGTTAERPNSYSTVGLQYFDTTINRPIWRNAANTGWIDATGAPV